MTNDPRSGGRASTGMNFARLMTQLTNAVSEAAVHVGQRRIGQVWQAVGRVEEVRDTVVLTGEGLRARRIGTRKRLADARLLWPEG